VLIRPKEGILDPQGKAVERALPALGFDEFSHVRIGRMVELEADSLERLSKLCEQLLANPLIEDYEIEVDTPAPAPGLGSSTRGPADSPGPGAQHGSRGGGGQ
jgi:phosphoribosylformylglycinamidine synthase subunit PurS